MMKNHWKHDLWVLLEKGEKVMKILFFLIIFTVSYVSKNVSDAVTITKNIYIENITKLQKPREDMLYSYTNN